MSTEKTRDGRATSKKYGWDSLQVGESGFKFSTPMQTAKDAWHAYKAKRPDLQGVRIEFREAYSGGVIYRRVE
jgi:hypothetical protein